MQPRDHGAGAGVVGLGHLLDLLGVGQSALDMEHVLAHADHDHGVVERHHERALALEHRRLGEDRQALLPAPRLDDRGPERPAERRAARDRARISVEPGAEEQARRRVGDAREHRLVDVRQPLDERTAGVRLEPLQRGVAPVRPEHLREDRVDQVGLGVEVAVEQGLGHADRRREIAGRAAEPMVGEEAARRLDDLGPAGVARQPRRAAAQGRLPKLDDRRDRHCRHPFVVPAERLGFPA